MKYGNENEILVRAYAKAVPVLRQAILLAYGDYNAIDFHAIRRSWLAQLSCAERQAILAHEAATAAWDENRGTTVDQTHFLRRLGCRNPPPPATLH